MVSVDAGATIIAVRPQRRKTMKYEICKTCQWRDWDKNYTCGANRWSEVLGENDNQGTPKSIYVISRSECYYIPFEDLLEENEEKIKELCKKYKVNAYDGFSPHKPIIKFSEL